MKEASTKRKGSSKQGSPKRKDKGKKNKKKPDWMLIPPKEGQAMTKMVNNKSYHWCTCHKAWTQHKPADCHGRNAPANTTDSSTNPERKLQLEHSLTTIAEDDDESL